MKLPPYSGSGQTQTQFQERLGAPQVEQSLTGASFNLGQLCQELPPLHTALYGHFLLWRAFLRLRAKLLGRTRHKQTLAALTSHSTLARCLLRPPQQHSSQNLIAENSTSCFPHPRQKFAASFVDPFLFSLLCKHQCLLFTYSSYCYKHNWFCLHSFLL